MAIPVKYMVDDKGQKTSVLVPIKAWTKINEDYSKLQKKIEILTGIKDSLQEIKSSRKLGKKLQTLKDFLSEGNN
jgi:hypothetical protein